MDFREEETTIRDYIKEIEEHERQITNTLYLNLAELKQIITEFENKPSLKIQREFFKNGLILEIQK